MLITTPTSFTLLRIGLTPIFVVAYYLPYTWSYAFATALFIVAGLTDWLDGYLARRLNQQSAFGAFLDPVADKLMVTTTLVLLVGDADIRESVVSQILFTIVVAIIIGREIVVSALREWMAELGQRASVAVSLIGKVKMITQIVAISLLIYRQPIGEFSTAVLGEILLYVAAGFTLWSMVLYLRAAWLNLGDSLTAAPTETPENPKISRDLTG